MMVAIAIHNTTATTAPTMIPIDGKGASISTEIKCKIQIKLTIFF